LLKVIDRNNEATQDVQQELNQDLKRLFRFGKEWLLEFQATISPLGLPSPTRKQRT